MNTTIYFETKSHYGGPELIYVTSEHQKPLQDLTGKKTLTDHAVKALKELGFELKQKGNPTKVLSSLSQIIKLSAHKIDDCRFCDYSKFLSHTPASGGEYYVLDIPKKEETPPKLGTNLNINGNKVVVFNVSTPEDIAKGRGGPVAKSMIATGIGWRVNCLPEGHEYLKNPYWLKKAKMDLLKLYRLEDDFRDSLQVGSKRGAIRILKEIVENIDDITVDLIKEEKTIPAKTKVLRELVSFGLLTAAYVIKYLEDSKNAEKDIEERCKRRY